MSHDASAKRQIQGLYLNKMLQYTLNLTLLTLFTRMTLIYDINKCLKIQMPYELVFLQTNANVFSKAVTLKAPCYYTNNLSILEVMSLLKYNIHLLLFLNNTLFKIIH